MIGWLVKRMWEPSTWRGIVAILTAFGLILSPEQKEAIIAGGLCFIGILGAFLPDKFKKPE